MDKSPNYCDENKLRRIPGTKERRCNRTSSETDGCQFLCCGRGYNTHEIVRRWDCHCKFNWCCYVKCRKCKERIEEFRCKWNRIPAITTAWTYLQCIWEMVFDFDSIFSDLNLHSSFHVYHYAVRGSDISRENDCFASDNENSRKSMGVLKRKHDPFHSVISWQEL